MFCSFCKKGASKLVTHQLGDCCLVHLECCDATVGNQLAVHTRIILPDEDAIRKVECDVCLEEFQEDELQRHREMCMPRLVFRCTLCDEDYLIKEGLWNHLSLHKIANDRKELYYQEKRVTYKQHNCILCNDHRCFQESVYWRHIHEDHDGFFLRCSECGESFRSQKLMTNHLNHCKSKEQAVPFESGGLEIDDDKNQDSLESGVVESFSGDFFDHISDLATECDDDRNGCYGQINDETEKISDMQPVSKLKNKKNNLTTNPTSERVDQPQLESSDVKCLHCNRMCSSAKALSRHIQYCHRPTTCNVCGVLCSTGNQLRYHKSISHSEDLYKCPQCPMEFQVKNSYHRHVASHQNGKCGIVSKFCCKICKRKVKSSGALTQHMRVFHGDCAKNQQQTQAKTFVKTDCPICRKSFSDQKQVSHHVLKIHNLTICKICGVTFDSDNEKNNHKCTLCPHCGRQCYNPTDLITHITKIHELTACDICGSSFVGKSQMKYHKLTVHSEPKYKCPYCSRKSYLKYDHRRHLSFCLKGKNFSCIICKRRFNKPAHFTDHIKHFHTVDQTQKDHGDCIEQEPCDALNVRQEDEITFKMESIVEAEETTLLKPENIMPYDQSECILPIVNVIDTRIPTNISKTLDGNPSSEFSDTKCPHCGKECYHRKRLTMHLTQRHEVIKCEICQTSIVGKYQSWYHKLTAHSEPKYKCTHCSKKFYLKNDYRRHMTVHEIIKRYPCKLCGHKFKSLHDVGRHTKQVHFVRKGQPNREQVDKITIKEEISELDDNGTQSKSLPSTVDNSSCGSVVKCPHCDKKLQQGKSLNRHIRTNHKPRTCNICAVTSENSQQLKYHKLTCHSEPSHKCPHCPGKFHMKSSLDRHVSSHRENKFPCKLCSLMFKTALSVSKHVRQSHYAKEVQAEAATM